MVIIIILEMIFLISGIRMRKCCRWVMFFQIREFEIIKLIESGLSSEQIAEKLFMSRYTVNTHRRNILEKTGKSKYLGSDL